MDWTSLIGGTPFGSLFLPKPGDPTSDAPGAPMNILPPVAQTTPSPVGILNGQKPNQDNQAFALQQAEKLMSPQTAVPSMPQIQMAKPLGAQGINPLALLASFNKNPLGGPYGMNS